MIFWRKIEEKLYQINYTIKNSENFTIGVYYSIEHHSINQVFMSFYILKNQYSMNIDPKFKLQLHVQL